MERSGVKIGFMFRSVVRHGGWCCWFGALLDTHFGACSRSRRVVFVLYLCNSRVIVVCDKSRLVTVRIASVERGR